MHGDARTARVLEIPRATMLARLNCTGQFLKQRYCVKVYMTRKCLFCFRWFGMCNKHLRPENFSKKITPLFKLKTHQFQLNLAFLGSENARIFNENSSF